jgi:hypothetical protein
LAEIEAKMPEPDLNFVQEILRTIWEARVKKLGEGHVLTLSAEFELASTYRDMNNLELAARTFEHVASLRRQHLGDTHPDTLAAQHECMVMNFTFGKIVAPKDIEAIFKSRERQLGRNHPDTLQSLMWTFAIQLIQKHATAYSTANDLLERLNLASVRSQRLVETLHTEERVALFCAGQQQFEKSRDILRGMEATLAGLDIDSKKKTAVIDLQLRVKGHLKLVDDQLRSAAV